MRFTKKFVCEFIWNSNQIENIHDTMETVEKIYDMMKKPKAKIHPVLLHESPEIVNTMYAIEFVKLHQNTRPTLNTIRELHKVLMDRLMPYKDEGCYRAMNVTVGGHSCPTPDKVHTLLNTLLERWEDKLTVEFPEMLGPGIVIPGNDDLDQKTGFICPEDFTSQFLRHLEFEMIHPFSDGNGRSGRLLYLWDCLYHGIKPDMILYELRSTYYATLRLYRGVLRPTLDVVVKK